MAIKILDIVFSIVAIGGGVLALIEKTYWSAGISLIIAGFLLIYFSAYTSQIDKNERDIKRLLEKLKIYEQLITMRGEIEYLKNEQKSFHR